MVNPGQDGDVKNDPTKNPEHEIAQAVEERAAEVEELRAVEEEGGVEVLADLMDRESVVDAQVGKRHGSGEGGVEESNEYLK